MVTSLELITSLLSLDDEDSTKELDSLKESKLELFELDETLTAQDDNDRAVNVTKILTNGIFFITLNIIN